MVVGLLDHLQKYRCKELEVWGQGSRLASPSPLTLAKVQGILLNRLLTL